MASYIPRRPRLYKGKEPLGPCPASARLEKAQLQGLRVDGGDVAAHVAREEAHLLLARLQLQRGRLALRHLHACAPGEIFPCVLQATSVGETLLDRQSQDCKAPPTVPLGHHPACKPDMMFLGVPQATSDDATFLD